MEQVSRIWFTRRRDKTTGIAGCPATMSESDGRTPHFRRTNASKVPSLSARIQSVWLTAP